MRSSGVVLFSCAGLLLSGGAILGGSAAWSLLRMSYYFWTSDLGVELSSSVLFIAGSLLCLPACWLSTIVPYHTKSLSLSATLISLVSVAMLVLSLGLSSLTNLSREVRDPAGLNASMLRAMTIDAFDPAVRSSFAAMQIELKCCGVHSYTDWYQHRHTLPPACCGRVWNGKRGEQCDRPLYRPGCLRPALTELRSYVNSLSALASAIVIVMAVTVFTAIYILVSGVMERNEAREFKFPLQPLRIQYVDGAFNTRSPQPLANTKIVAGLPQPLVNDALDSQPLQPFVPLVSPAARPGGDTAF